MGSYASPADWSDESEDDEAPRLGDLLSGRFSGVSLDSVESVRGVRERE